MSSPTPTAVDGSSQRLRIVNNSNTTLDDLVVQFPNDRIDFGRVEAGATTEYLTAPNGVYRYAAYTWTIDEKPYAQPVTDWVGETAMEGSAFTYVLSVGLNGALVTIDNDVQRDE